MDRRLFVLQMSHGNHRFDIAVAVLKCLQPFFFLSFCKQLDLHMKRKQRRQIFQIKSIELPDYLNWAHHFFRNSNKFQKQHGLYPNFTFGSSNTSKGIDTIANAMSSDNFLNKENPFEDKSGFEPITGFNASKFNIEFYVNDDLEDREIVLIYDSDPYIDIYPHRHIYLLRQNPVRLPVARK